MKVMDIMTKNIISCKSDSTIYDVAKLVKEYNIGFIPIIDNDLIEVITDRDIVINSSYSNDYNILGYINNNIIYINDDKDINEALYLMGKYKIKRLMVKDEKEIVGILSLSDILNKGNDKDIINTIKSIYEIIDNNINDNNEIDDFYL